MSIKSNEPLWNATIQELKQGYVEQMNHYECLLCKATFLIGQIFEVDGNLYDAKKAMELHIEKKHQSMLHYLLQRNASMVGITNAQHNLLYHIALGKTDKEIAEELDIALSTIRNHRFKIREKEKQARLFVAMMEMLSEVSEKGISSLDKGVLCDPHKTATMIDERFNITEDEKLNVIETYFSEDGSLKSYPTKAKRKVIVLEKIAERFKVHITYTEKEVNEQLKPIFSDFVSIRRALLEYGFLDRSKDCSAYWVKE